MIAKLSWPPLKRLRAYLCTIGLLLVGAALPQTPSAAQLMPVGLDFMANTYTPGIQSDPAVAIDGGGNFIVAWHSENQDGSGFGVYAQRFDSNAAPLGSEFRVNSYTPADQWNPAIGADFVGGFVVVWQSGGYALSQDGDREGVFGRRFTSQGTPIGSEFQVNTFITGAQHQPAIIVRPGGEFEVAFQGVEAGPHGTDSAIFLRRYTTDGVPIAAETKVNTSRQGAGAALVALPDGGTVVTWEGYNNTGFFQRFSSSGSPVGSETQVNTSSIFFDPSISASAGGDFLIAWTNQDATFTGIGGRIFDSVGNPLTSQLRINDQQSVSERGSSVAAEPAGNFTVTYMSYTAGSHYNIVRRSFSAAGTALENEMVVNSNTTGVQGYGAIRSNPSGDFIVAWSNFLSSEDRDIGARRFAADNIPTAAGTATATATATGTATATDTASATHTNSPTATDTQTATTDTGTPTATATNPPTATATNATPTAAATVTNTPRRPLSPIIRRLLEHLRRIFGSGTPNIPPPFLQIWSVGQNGAVENGGGDDEMLGSGGTDAGGEFQSSPGIGLDRPLRMGEMIYALDLANGLSGPAAPVAGVALPTGATCSDASFCELGFCEQGVCCDRLCAGRGESCNQPGSRGQCAATIAPAPALSPVPTALAVLLLVLVGATTIARARQTAR
jgi:hypothetical protein